MANKTKQTKADKERAFQAFRMVEDAVRNGVDLATVIGAQDVEPEPQSEPDEEPWEEPEAAG